jgi:hypothetical protein
MIAYVPYGPNPEGFPEDYPKDCCEMKEGQKPPKDYIVVTQQEYDDLIQKDASAVQEIVEKENEKERKIEEEQRFKARRSNAYCDNLPEITALIASSIKNKELDDLIAKIEASL